MDGPPFCLAFVMVKESFVVPAIFFYLESAANKIKDKGRTTLIYSQEGFWDLVRLYVGYCTSRSHANTLARGLEERRNFEELLTESVGCVHFS